MHCLGVYKQNSIVNSVRVDDWTAEWAVIASNGITHFINVSHIFHKDASSNLLK